MRSPIIALRDAREARGQHAGLLLQRYLCGPATGERDDPAEKQHVLKAAIRAAQNDGATALYRIAFDRWNGLLSNDGVSKSIGMDLEVGGRLIVGLGSENVLETGLRLHHTFGMPIIPGSALKGLAAHYCHQVWGESDRGDAAPVESKRFRCGWKEPGQEHHPLLFGSTDDSGCIVFHDAWHIPGSSPSPLVRDVMTPHHPQWLAGSVPPTDFDSPTPVPFLSVTGKFHVALSWRGPEGEAADEWLKLAQSLLCEALAEWGVGGKTTSGYGRLVGPGTNGTANGSSTASGAATGSSSSGGYRYDKGHEIEVIKYLDAAGKPKFRTPDNLVAHAGGEDVSDISENVPVKMWVKNRNLNPKGYTLTRKPPTSSSSGSHQKQGKRHGRN